VVTRRALSENPHPHEIARGLEIARALAELRRLGLPPPPRELPAVLDDNGPGKCGFCGMRFRPKARGRPRKWCSPMCRDWAREERERGRHGWSARGRIHRSSFYRARRDARIDYRIRELMECGVDFCEAFDMASAETTRRGRAGAAEYAAKVAYKAEMWAW
jgi:hypothetical protein